jgi:hypothetical protein
MTANANLIRSTLFAILFSLTFINTFSQNSLSVKPVITNLKAIVENNHIVLNWNVSEMESLNYCKVQASLDGINFYTMGIVTGANPRDANKTFSFKQNLSKIRPGQVHYRVLQVAADETAYSSNVAKVL